MKRDWELIRKQLTDIEEDKDILADFPKESRWTDQTEEEFAEEYARYQSQAAQLVGHYELLLDANYVEGFQVQRGADNSYSYSMSCPRLTMKGHDLLDTIRSKSVWNQIKSTARAKGMELTFDTIKVLAASVVKQSIGT